MEAKGEYRSTVLDYLGRLYAEGNRAFACRASSAEEAEVWRERARPELRRILGLERMADGLSAHVPTVELGPVERMDGYSRRRCTITTEPEIALPFWLLHPEGKGPFPLGVFPHGHDETGMDTCVGVYDSEEKWQKIEAEDRDVAVQAALRGFVAIAPTTRGFGEASVPDLSGRHGDRHCRSQLLHCLLAGRTAVGERVWDMERLIDWGSGLEGVDGSRVLVMGNSGGGVVTVYAAACDERVSVAVPSCSFCTLVGEDGLLHHCDCNAVPGILNFGEFHDVAGLIAPRPLLIVNGREDSLFPLAEVDRGVRELRRIYAAAGVEERFAHQYGEGGHRFYADLMWPFIEATIGPLRR